MREFLINNIRLNDYMDILSVTESILPPLSTHRTPVPGKPGTLFIRQVIDEKVVKVRFNIRAESFEERSEKMDGLNPILYTGEELEITLPNRRKYKAVIDGVTDLSNALFDGYGELSFLATDPISYGDVVEEDLLPSNTFYYKGTYETRGVVISNINSFTQRVRIQLISDYASSYDFIEIDDTFEAGDLVVIDMEKETVMNNGVYIMDKVNWSGDFFDIKPGYYTLLFEGGYGVFRYKERWS